MSKLIDNYISENNIIEAIFQCIRENQNHLGLLLAKISIEQELISLEDFNNIKIKLEKNIIGDALTNTEVVGAINLCNENPSLMNEEVKEEVQEIVEGEIVEEKVFEGEEVIHTPLIKVKLYCNWASSKELCDLWNKMSKGNYRWNNIQLVWEEGEADYYVIINRPPVDAKFIPEKTILFRMEPNMENDKAQWGEWSSPTEGEFKFIGFHNKHYNNNEWHLSKTYTELSTEPVVKNEELSNILSTVLSNKYADPGHIKRIDFVKFLEQKDLNVDVFGGNKFGWKNYKGSLPSHQKDNAMFPYKYTFNVENQSIRGYYTEKLIDGILAETLVFYHGCPNIRDYFDEKTFVWLELVNFEEDYNKIKQAIEENWWEQRLPYIKEAKQKILNEKQFFPRLEKILEC